MKITFCGAAREVTGSSYYVEGDNVRFLVDCGLFQGNKVADEKNQHEFPFDPKKLDFVLLTHAHLDHCGRIPLLCKRGFKGKVYTVEPTVGLARLILEDAAGLIGNEAQENDEEPLYTIANVVEILDRFEGYKYHEPTTVKGVRFEFFDAGHILGSAIIKVVVDGKTIVFSGDLGNPPVPLLKTTEFLKSADYVLIESTYGNRRHEDVHLRTQRLISALRTSVMNNGVLLIPAFAVERTQEILHDINEAVEKGNLPYFPMFLDSPLAIRATEVFKEYSHYYNQQALAELTKDDDLFSFPGLKMTDTTEQSKMINNVPSPKVIMAGSGMMHGGRIRHHLRRYLEEKNCTLLIVGYMVEGSLGRDLYEGAKSIKLFGDRINVNAKVIPIGAFSGHADQPKLLEWLDHFTHKPQRIFVTHGEEQSALDLAESIKKTMGIDTEVPYLFDEVTLD